MSDAPTDTDLAQQFTRSFDFEQRLRNLQIDVAVIKNDVGHIKDGIAEMATKKDIEIAATATKKDISDLKVWILGGVLTAIVIAATIATVVVKAFF